jgi:hypothetical protein
LLCDAHLAKLSIFDEWVAMVDTLNVYWLKGRKYMATLEFETNNAIATCPIVLIFAIDYPPIGSVLDSTDDLSVRVRRLWRPIGALSARASVR